VGFRKTSKALSVRPLSQEEARELGAPRIGDIRDGLVWDGQEWIPVEEWEPTQEPDE
jgi:hypothetical protein